MSQPIVKHWAPSSANTATISSSQAYAAAGSVKINPNPPSPEFAPTGSYAYSGMVRKIALTSTANISAVNFVVTGIGTPIDAAGNPTQSLAPISETIVGPNIATVQSVNIYSRIDSITFNAPVANLSVGFGNAGITSYVFTDYDRTAWYATYQTAVYNRAALTSTVYVSLTKPETPSTRGSLIAYPQAIPATMVGTLDNIGNQLLTTAYPVAIVWATIKAAPATAANETLYFTVLQQGMRS